jgi:hypothetical protein
MAQSVERQGNGLERSGFEIRQQQEVFKFYKNFKTGSDDNPASYKADSGLCPGVKATGTRC